jgi:hypothetical protein
MSIFTIKHTFDNYHIRCTIHKYSRFDKKALGIFFRYFPNQPSAFFHPLLNVPSYSVILYFVNYGA